MKISLIIIVICVLILSSGIYLFWLSRIDTRYAIAFSGAFENKDIEKCDEYFSPDTLFICGEEKV